MLKDQERQAIEGLFDKLETVERQGAPRDPEAEALIRRQLAAAPNAAYYMAQTILVQEFAMQQAQQRIEELEQQVQSQRSTGGAGGFLGGLFGNNDRRDYGRADARDYGQQQRPRGPWGNRDAAQYGGGYAGGGGFGGGGFLAGAAQTAMGVAGGVLLGNAIAGMFGASPAWAGEADQGGDNNDSGGDNYDDNADQDQGGDDNNDFGGDDGGDSDFDTGGDF